MNEITYTLPVFEGPLPLLLHLIEKDRIDICDVEISSLFSQFMEYVESYKELDLDNVSEFVVMAAQLIYIKSRMLLPREEEDGEDPRGELIEMIVAYKKYKEAAEALAGMRESVGLNLLTKDPEPVEPDSTYRRRHSVDELVRAYFAMTGRLERRRPPEVSSFIGVVRTAPVPIAGRISRILKSLTQKGRIFFSELFMGETTRSGLVASFLAVLELIRTSKVTVRNGYRDGEEDLSITLGQPDKIA